MLDNFITVFFQVVALFLMMLFGVVGQKRKMINDEASHVITDITMFFVTPCLIVNSFIRKFESEKLKELLLVLGLAFLIHGISILIAHFFFKNKKDSNACVLRFGVVFSNVGYMGIPLQEAVLGSEGVFFGAAYVSVFQMVLWSYGIICMSESRKSLSIKKAILNPGIIGTIAGLVVFIFSVNIPGVFRTVISSMASLNTPLAMILVGYFLAKSNLLDALKSYKVYIAAFLRLIVIPMLAILVLYLIGFRGVMPVSIIIAASAPIAAATSMFSAKFEKNTALASNLVTITTLLSIFTMPLIVAIAQRVFL